MYRILLRLPPRVLLRLARVLRALSDFFGKVSYRLEAWAWGFEQVGEARRQQGTDHFEI